MKPDPKPTPATQPKPVPESTDKKVTSAVTASVPASPNPVKQAADSSDQKLPSTTKPAVEPEIALAATVIGNQANNDRQAVPKNALEVQSADKAEPGEQTEVEAADETRGDDASPIISESSAETLSQPEVSPTSTVDTKATVDGAQLSKNVITEPKSIPGKPSSPSVLTEGLALETNEKPGTTPLMNLLTGSKEPVAVVAAAVSPLPNQPPPVAGAIKQRHWALPIVIVGLLTLVAGVATVYGVSSGRKAAPKVAVATPTLAPSPSATPSPVATPTPSAAPSPAAVAAPETVTAPAVAPTQDHPQSVTVQAPNGVWLRSSPSSVNQKNVISWIPRGGVVSVDSVGDFWWHGTYNGKTGYFASKYTR